MMARSFGLIVAVGVLGCLMIIGCDHPPDSNASSQTSTKSSPVSSKSSSHNVTQSDLHQLQKQLADASSQLEETRQQLELVSQQKMDAEQELERVLRRHQLTQQKIKEAQRILANLDSQESTQVNKHAVDPAARSTAALSVNFLSWNVESEGSDPATIAIQLSEFQDIDVYALTEVLPESFNDFLEAVGSDFISVESRTGRNDRMQILYDGKRFELIRKLELDEINFQYRYRSPLVAHLRDKESGIEFLVMVNHLARGKAEVRQKQAQQLVDWAREQTLPIVALGDYNLDYVFRTQNGNEAFRIMLRDNIWKWVKPEEWIDTNWFDHPEHPDGKDDHPGSMLDFAFLANAAKNWNAACRVLVRPGDFPDDEKTSDHRPFELRINSTF